MLSLDHDNDERGKVARGNPAQLRLVNFFGCGARSFEPTVIGGAIGLDPLVDVTVNVIRGIFAIGDQSDFVGNIVNVQFGHLEQLCGSRVVGQEIISRHDKKEHGNPAKGIPLFKQQSDGWEPWPDDVRAEFEALASKRARLVYELCVGTGQRIGDVVKMKWEHFSDEGFDFTQGKTDKPLWIPLTDRLKAHLDGIARTDGTVVTNAKGRPVSYRIVAEEMRTIKMKMKHENASYYKTHGLRKNATIELYLAGCDDEMVKAVTGHSGVEMLKRVWRSDPAERTREAGS